MERLAKILVVTGLCVGIASLLSTTLIGKNIAIDIFTVGFIICAIGVLIGWHVSIQAYNKSK